MTPEQLAQLRRQLAAQLIATLTVSFLGLGAWRAAERALFLTQAVPLVRGAQRVLAGLVGVYQAAQATAALGRLVAPPSIGDGSVLDLRGVDVSEVYRRPFATVYTALAEGKPLAAAVDHGATRLGQVAEMDLQQTYAEASRAAMQALPLGARPNGWRRVLVGEQNCAMCVIASTQRYQVADLNPIHPGCDCAVAPLYGEQDRVVDPALLEQIHAAVEELTGRPDRGARAVDYRQLMTSMTPDHGELGPMLVRPRDAFTSRRGLRSDR